MALLPHDDPIMFTFRIEVAGAEANEPDAHYLVTAENATIAMLMAILVDQYTPVRPTDPQCPMEIDEENQIALSREYGKVLP